MSSPLIPSPLSPTFIDSQSLFFNRRKGAKGEAGEEGVEKEEKGAGEEGERGVVGGGGGAKAESGAMGELMRNITIMAIN